MTPDLQALIELSEKATPGPWGWRNRHGQIEIAAPHGGGTVVMGFVRDGMRGAQPVFGVSLDGLPRGKRGGILRSAKDLIADDPDGELSHPDAQFMVAAANYVRNLLTAPTLPGAGGGDALTDSDVYSLIGEAAIQDGHDMPAYYLGLARRGALAIGNIALADRAGELLAALPPQKGG